jgi:hypothetical protein
MTAARGLFFDPFEERADAACVRTEIASPDTRSRAHLDPRATIGAGFYPYLGVVHETQERRPCLGSEATLPG